MTPNPVVWFEICVRDMNKARSFYEAVLGGKLEKLDSPDPDIEMMAFPMQRDSGGAAGALARIKDAPSGAGGTIVYFRCEDCAVEAGRVDGNGGKVMKSKFPIGAHGFIALAADPEGNMFGLHSMH